MIDRMISVVVPSYNEHDNIRPLHERLSAALRAITRRYEIIFVDNGSTDGSGRLFAELVSQDPNVVVLSYARNFTSQGAVTGGLARARGDCVVCIDGDLQDPPELIAELVRRWEEGYDIVYGIRTRRPEGIVRRMGYHVFYRLLRRMSDIDIPLDASDFALVDRRVVDVLNAMPERERFVRWMRAWVGFRHTGVPYARSPRHSGRTKMPLMENFRWASSAIVSFSQFPLELISLLLMAVTGVSVLGIGYYLVAKLREDIPHGITTIVVLLLTLSVIQMLSLAIIGAYVGRILIEVKGRPPYIIKEVLGAGAGPPPRREALVAEGAPRAGDRSEETPA